MNSQLKDALEMEANGVKGVDCATPEMQSNKESASHLQAWNSTECQVNEMKSRQKLA